MKELYHQIEFNKVVELASVHAVSDEAIHTILNPVPRESRKELMYDLNITEELSFLLKLVPFSLQHFENLEPEFKLMQISGATGSVQAILGILKIANNELSLKGWINKDEAKSLTNLQNLVSLIPDLTQTRKIILKVFDKDSVIRSDASPELQMIRKSLINAKSSSYRVFKNELQSYRKQNVLAEGEESVSNGRYVLRVLAEHKRKVKGVITGESESGKTIFIEPLICVQLNNEIISLEQEERKEELKILRELSSLLQPFIEDIKNVYAKLIQTDVCLAKAKLGILMKASKPILSRKKNIRLIKAFHPLLQLHLAAKGMETVALNIELDTINRIILVSGPNAGGKSVVLKTIGLFQVMLTNGYLIPAGKDSVVHLFDQMFLDIGDQQSVENDLSTYSAKLKFLQNVLTNGNAESLLLIDEFGSGTDPMIGGSIAEAALEKFIDLGTYGVITTHYSNLKALAHNKKGLTNACMLYDEKAMEAKYVLEIGKPGSSYAFDMADKLMFPKQILREARKKMDKGVVNFEDLIRRLEQEKLSLIERNQDLMNKIESLNKLIRAYELMNHQHEVKKLKLKLESKGLDYEKALEKKAESNRLIKEIEEKLDLVKARQLAEERLRKLKSVEQEYVELNSKFLDKLQTSVELKDLKVGDEVVLFKNNLKGTISKIRGSKVEVTTEFITLKVDYKELNLSQKKEELIKKPKAELDLVTKASMMSGTIDLRGSLPSEAIKQLEDYIDLSLLSNLKEFKIVHGKGSGKLRKSVHDLLKKNKFIKSWKHPEESEGGNGITIAQFTE